MVSVKIPKSLRKLLRLLRATVESPRVLPQHPKYPKANNSNSCTQALDWIEGEAKLLSQVLLPEVSKQPFILTREGS